MTRLRRAAEALDVGRNQAIGGAHGRRTAPIVAPSPIWVGTAADNGRLAGLFESMGYVIDDRLRLSQASSRALLGLVLLLDLGLLVGLVVSPGAWVFVLLPVMWLVTLLWALPRLR
ncbi:MAG: hypothetical protein Q7W51_07835 [Coriobacteriia bacterium]|nr:hypothetical protein [Coriobacteriia bacterium]